MRESDVAADPTAHEPAAAQGPQAPARDDCQGDPARLAALLATRPDAHPELLARAHAEYGNALVGQAIDLADAEAYNRAHVVDVVRFDFATKGRFAKPNGQLDAAKIIAFQQTHGLPATGKVDENTCLVAEGKPPLPGGPLRFDGVPSLTIVHPRGETYPPDRPIPLTVRVDGPAGSLTSIRWRLLDAESQEVLEEHALALGIGRSNVAVADLRMRPSLAGRRLRSLRVEAEGEANDPEGTNFAAQHAGFDLVQPLGLLAPPAPFVVGDEPEVPVPGDLPTEIDQPEAEAWNRAHVPEVVRFDRATRGYFAKPNGELDALAVGEWQREQRLLQTGRVDERTAATAEEVGGGLDPNKVPGDGVDLGFHGPPLVHVVAPFAGAALVPGTMLLANLRAQPNSWLDVAWSLVSPRLGLVAVGSGRTMTGADGGAVLSAALDAPMAPHHDEAAVLEVAVTGRLGAAPLEQRQVVLRGSRR